MRPRDDRDKREYEDKDSRGHRTERQRTDDRDRIARSADRPSDNAQNYPRAFQNNVPPRFRKKMQTEWNQSVVSANNVSLCPPLLKSFGKGS